MGRFYSDELEKGIRLLYFQTDHKKYPEGVRLIQKAMEKDEANAYYFMARCYGWGNGDSEVNEEKARQLSLQGIKKGSALCVLGADRMNMFKDALEQASPYTREEALEEVVKLATAGEPMAQYAVGLFYYWGDMLVEIQKPQTKEEFERAETGNKKNAMGWFRAAAEQGCIPAFGNLFCGLREGRYIGGIDLPGAVKIAKEYENKVDQKEYFCDIALACEKLKRWDEAVYWYEKGVRQDNAICADYLGLCYYNGDGTIQKDYKKALLLFEQAAALGNADACYNLGRCYFHGNGTTVDQRIAFDWFLKSYETEKKRTAAALSYVNYYLGWMYLEGLGTPVDEAAAFKHSKQAVEGGSNQAKLYLGRCYLEGKGTFPDVSRGKLLIEECVKETKMGRAYRYLGMIYDRGLGVEENLEQAVSYYEQAVQKGFKEAELDLKRFKKTLFGKWKRR